jgi:hypothetical protein
MAGLRGGNSELMRLRRMRGFGCLGCLPFGGLFGLLLPVLIIGAFIYFLVNRQRPASRQLGHRLARRDAPGRALPFLRLRGILPVRLCFPLEPLFHRAPLRSAQNRISSELPARTCASRQWVPAIRRTGHPAGTQGGGLVETFSGNVTF